MREDSARLNLDPTVSREVTEKGSPTPSQTSRRLRGRRERLGTRLGGPDGKQCGMNYTGETERTLKARVSEHRRPSSSTSEVSNHLFREHRGHQFRSENVKILDREPDWFRRGIKKAVYIPQLQPSLKRDGETTSYLG